jgi:hypothetical protein
VFLGLTGFVAVEYTLWFICVEITYGLWVLMSTDHEYWITQRGYHYPRLDVKNTISEDLTIVTRLKAGTENNTHRLLVGIPDGLIGINAKVVG